MDSWKMDFFTKTVFILFCIFFFGGSVLEFLGSKRYRRKIATVERERKESVVSESSAAADVPTAGAKDSREEPEDKRGDISHSLPSNHQARQRESADA